MKLVLPVVMVILFACSYALADAIEGVPAAGPSGLQQFEQSLTQLQARFAKWHRQAQQKGDKSESSDFTLELRAIEKEASNLRQQLRKVQSASSNLSKSDREQLRLYLQSIEDESGFFYHYVFGVNIELPTAAGEKMGTRGQVKRFIKGQSNALPGYDARPDY